MVYTVTPVGALYCYLMDHEPTRTTALGFEFLPNDVIMRQSEFSQGYVIPVSYFFTIMFSCIRSEG